MAGTELCSHVKHFLGYHMIKEFEVLDFLEESGGQAPFYLPMYRESADLWKLALRAKSLGPYIQLQCSSDYDMLVPAAHACLDYTRMCGAQ